MFSREKSAFRQPEILVVGHFCVTFSRKPSPTKVDAIEAMKEECTTQREVICRFLGACAFYHILIPHYTHVVEPLYRMLKKKRMFEWRSKHTLVIRRLKELLLEARVLRKVDYAGGNPSL
jgi:hypothetical protein